MKVGNTYRMRGKHFSTLILIVFMTVFLCSMERRPPSTTLFSTPDHLDLPGSDVTFAASHFSRESVKPKYHAVQEGSNLYEDLLAKSEMLSLDDGSNDADFAPSTPSKTGKNGSNSASSLNGEGAGSEAHSFDSSDVDSTPAISSVTEQSKRRLKPSYVKKGRKEAYQEDVLTSVRSGENRVCNYAKGRWVVDKRRPLYSGMQCKQWLSEMWSCRLTQRPDFSYEAYRWQPENCEMPEFDRSEFLQRMQDKTIAFVGDSLGRQQFQSLMCMVTGGEDHPEVEDIGSEYGFVIDPGAVRPNGWAFRFPQTNTTILYYWSACLCDLEPLNSTDPATEVAMHLDRPPSFLQRFLPQFDVLILNTGHHWNRGKVNANRWVMHTDGKPLRDRKLAMIGNAKNLTVHSIARWVDGQLDRHPHIKAFFRTISPRHFFNGDWNTGGSCENTTPLAKGSVVVQNESSDPVIADAVKGAKRVRLLDITALSMLRDEGHISRYSVKASQGIQDCLHWCLPGIPDTWNEIVAAQV